MTDAINSAISGLANASKRLETAANHIAKAGLKPADSTQQADTTKQSGTTQPTDKVTLSDDATQALSQLSQGSGDITNDLIQTNQASYDFKANLKTLQVQNNIQQSLLDIFS
jgi:flagellar basal body rod protein FlgC